MAKATRLPERANRKRFFSVRLLWIALAGALPPTAASASETIAYTYDALGRLKQASHSGTVNSGVNASYGFDAADNRTNVTVTAPAGAAPSFAISDASVTEGGDLVFTVTKTGTASGSLTVNYATADNTATFSGADYLQKSGTLTFAVGSTSQTITVPSFVDHATEGTEKMFVNLSAPSGGATITRSQGVGTIFDGS